MPSGSQFPPWKEALFELFQSPLGPTFSQNHTAETVCNISDAVDIFAPALDSLDLKSPEVIKALIDMFEVGATNGGFFCLHWFYSFDYSTTNYVREAQKSQDGLRHCLNKVCREFLTQSFEPNSNKPKVLVPMWIATAVACWLFLFGVTDVDTSEAAVEQRKLLERTCETAIKSLTPRIRSKCDQYVAELGFSYPADGITNIVLMTQVSLECAIVSSESGFDLKQYKALLKDLHRTIGELPDFSKQGWLISKARLNLAGADYQFQRLSECYLHRVRTSIEKTDPKHDFWWKTGALYLEVLQLALKEAKEEKPQVDWFAVATLTRQLLQTMVSGGTKSVSYTKLEALCKELRSTVSKCKAWTLPIWQIEMETFEKIITNEILPFILRKSGEEDKESASIHVFTPGFLDILKRETVWERLYADIRTGGKMRECGYCGVYDDGMMKCSACKSVWYCDSACQKKHWKVHKKECRILAAGEETEK